MSEAGSEVGLRTAATTYSDPRKRRGGCSRHGRKRQSVACSFWFEQKQNADCVDGSRVRRVRWLSTEEHTRTAAVVVVMSMTSVHRSTQHTTSGSRRDEGTKGIWNCAADLLAWVRGRRGRRQVSGRCRRRVVREYRCTWWQQCKGSGCLFWCSQ